MPSDTARLVFREMSHDDLDNMAAVLADPEVMTYYSDKSMPIHYHHMRIDSWLGKA